MRTLVNRLLGRDSQRPREADAVADEDAQRARLEKLRRAILDSDGSLDPELRRALFAGEPAPPELEPYVDKVRRHAYRVTDDDVARLLEGGLSEDEVFELTIAVAAGAGFERLDAGLRAIEGA